MKSVFFTCLQNFYNPGYNICAADCVSVEVCFATVIRVTSRVSKRFKTDDLRKLRNDRTMSNLRRKKDYC